MIIFAEQMELKFCERALTSLAQSAPLILLLILVLTSKRFFFLSLSKKNCNLVKVTSVNQSE